MSSSYQLLRRESLPFLELLRRRHRYQRAGQPTAEGHREAMKSLAGYLVALLLELLLVFSLHSAPLASWPFYGFEEGAQHPASQKLKIVKIKRRNSIKVSQELPDVQIAKPGTDEVTNRDFLTEKIELPTQDNQPEYGTSSIEQHHL